MAFESMIVFLYQLDQSQSITFLIGTSRFLIRASFGSLINFFVAVDVWLISNLVFLFSVFFDLSNSFLMMHTYVTFTGVVSGFSLLFIAYI
jgi:hypothetical protein